VCIIIVKPKSQMIDKKLASYCWKRNSDGAGFMFADKNRIRIYREFDDFEKFWTLYQKFVVNPLILCTHKKAEKHVKESRELHKNVIMHFRIATSGEKSKYNVHPFQIHKNLAFAHNGIITGITLERDSKRSDTNAFNEMLKKLPNNWVKNEPILEMIDNYIGMGSKLAFLDSEGHFAFMKEDKGIWDKDTGLWFSNATFHGWTWEGLRENERTTTANNSMGFLGNRNRSGDMEDGLPRTLACEVNFPNHIHAVPGRNVSESVANINRSLQRSAGADRVAENNVNFTMVNKSDIIKGRFTTCKYCGMIVYSREEIAEKRCNLCVETAELTRKRDIYNRNHLH